MLGKCSLSACPDKATASISVQLNGSVEATILPVCAKHAQIPVGVGSDYSMGCREVGSKVIPDVDFVLAHIPEFKGRMVCLLEFGAHLYGTDTVQSDRDYKGIFLPDISSCYLGTAPKHLRYSSKEGEGKNTSEDIDIELYSLQYFLQMATAGEMIVIDMLHATKKHILISSDIWCMLQKTRSAFYSKNMQGYLGYIRKQTAKYCVKGSRLATIEIVLDYLSQYQEDTKMSVVWSGLPKLEHTFFEVSSISTAPKMYRCCGKLIQDTVTVQYARNILQSMFDQYGARAVAAKNNEGIDWKAVSHAYRACYQLEEIFTTGDLQYPLQKAQHVKDLKYGLLHYVQDRVGEDLDSLVLSVETLAKNSTYPDVVDEVWVEAVMHYAYKDDVR